MGQPIRITVDEDLHFIRIAGQFSGFVVCGCEKLGQLGALRPACVSVDGHMQCKQDTESGYCRRKNLQTPDAHARLPLAPVSPWIWRKLIGKAILAIPPRSRLTPISVPTAHNELSGQ